MLVLKPAKKGGKKLPPYTWKYIDTDKRPFVNYEAFIYAFECPFFFASCGLLHDTGLVFIVFLEFSIQKAAESYKGCYLSAQS